MTGPGTNTYLVGREQLAVIDPGPDIAAHIDKILAQGAGRIRWVIVTHTHPDHSPGARQLIEQTGAEAIGSVMDKDDGHQDRTFSVSRNIGHGDLLRTGEFTLEAIHTPGHVSNHFCYLLRDENLLFAGDHMMQGTSVLVLPPSGDLGEYLESLTRLKRYQIDAIAPGHGELIRDPLREIDLRIRHRFYREGKVIAALEKLGESSLERLVPDVYDDVHPTLHKAAQYSLWAHLLKLEKEKIAIKTIEKHWLFGEEHWRLTDDYSKSVSR